MIVCGSKLEPQTAFYAIIDSNRKDRDKRNIRFNYFSITNNEGILLGGVVPCQPTALSMVPSGFLCAIWREGPPVLNVFALSLITDLSSFVLEVLFSY